MNGRPVRGLTPWSAMRKRLDQPAMTRSGHERASALSMASAMPFQDRPGTYWRPNLPANSSK